MQPVKKKIAILIPNLSNGGAEKMASELSMVLAQRYKVYLFLFDESKVDYSYSGELIDLKLPPVSSIWLKPIRAIHRILRVKRLKKELKIDATISFLENANVTNLFSKCKDKTILTIHNYNSRRNYGLMYEKVYAFMMKWFYNKADTIVAVSKMIKKDLVVNYGVLDYKIKVIYNFINTNEIKRLKDQQISAEYLKQDAPLVVNIGRMYHQKGQKHLIRAFTEVIENIPDAELVILGSGELRQELKNLAKECGIEKQVHLPGFQSNPYKWLGAADIFVLSSLYEGLGIVLLEAMGCGVPVISTDCKSGPREILAPDTNLEEETNDIEYAQYGILVPTCDKSAIDSNHVLSWEEQTLAKSIIEMLKNSEKNKEYAIKSAERATDFDIDKIVTKWYNMVDDILTM